MNKNSTPPEIGRGVTRASSSVARSWVQTERSAHEAWGNLIARRPAAARLMHVLVAYMSEKNAVVVSQQTLAQIMGVTDRTVRNALDVLVSERWVQVVRLGAGREAAYVVNSRVAWAQKRDDLRLSHFDATVIANASDQDTASLDETPLRRIPVLYPSERQLPTGDGLPPPSQPFLDGLEPDLPSKPNP